MNELRAREKELVFEVETVNDKNSKLHAELQSCAQVRDLKARLEKELEMTKRQNAALTDQVSQAKEQLLKAETIKEVAKTKE